MPVLRSLVALALLGGLAAAASPAADPAHDLVRLQVTLSTNAPAATLTLHTGTIANASAQQTDGPSSVQLSTTHDDLVLQGNTAGQNAGAQFQAIVAGIGPDQDVTWTLQTQLPGTTSGEIDNLNAPSAPALVDRFQTSQATDQWTTPSTALRAGGPLRMQPAGARLVLAVFYPWYLSETWASPQFLDQPLVPYSTENPQDVGRVLAQAQGAGLDGLIVSWQGGVTWSDERLRIVLAQAAPLGLKISTLLETAVANPALDAAEPPDPATVQDWLATITDAYGSSPAYLHLTNRPVIFVYAANLLSPAQWHTIISGLHASRRDPVLILDSTNRALLSDADGEFIYASAGYDPSAIGPFDQTQSLTIRTFNLLTTNSGERRIWPATVSPGYNDTLLTDRTTHQVIPRAGGALYNAQWQGAILANADWVVVTSWNEWYENTEIEPGRLFGSQYLDLTRTWASLFHRAFLSPRPRREP
ncbi:MAG TPA: hypothetical protein VNE16_16495 [Vicinamibacterales bacterium]|nr:hypothetical protein [Vicinamibacterales bacterium]